VLAEGQARDAVGQIRVRQGTTRIGVGVCLVSYAIVMRWRDAWNKSRLELLQQQRKCLILPSLSPCSSVTFEKEALPIDGGGGKKRVRRGT